MWARPPRINLSSLRLTVPDHNTHAPNMCKGGDDTRLERPTGTEIKTLQTQFKCASYLHPFFFMMFPSTTSALQRRWREKARLNKDKS